MRRDTGESYEEFLTKLAKASGIETPTRADLARIDRKRKKKGSNDDWTHPHDPDAKITKMKDGRTHLAHKAEHAVDLETGAIVGVTVQGADEGDTTTIQETLAEAVEQLEAVAAVTDDAVAVIEELVADKGYHSRTTVHDLETLEIRTYISEPDRGPQSWIDQEAERDAVYANRRRIRGDRGKRLLRRRGRIARTAERASLRDRRHAAHAPARPREHSQAAARSCERLQSGTLDADALRRRHAARPSGPRGGARRAPPHGVDLHLFRDDGTLGSITRFGEITGYRRWIRHHGVVRLKNATLTLGGLVSRHEGS